MVVFTDYLWFQTPDRQEFVRITDDVQRIVDASGVDDGMVLVSAMHITSGVYVNDWEDGLIHDFQVWLEKLDLGPWEQVFYAEFDGQRKKRVVVKVMGA